MPSAAPSVAVGILCKTPAPGRSKTRLAPPLKPEQCAGLSACFIRDLSSTIGSLGGSCAPFAVYTPKGSEAALRELLPAQFNLHPQIDCDDFGPRLQTGLDDLLKAGYAGAILINSDSPTLPASILERAVDAVLSGDSVVLSPAYDGGYTLIGLSKMHPRLFEDIPWSTPSVYDLTLERAREIGLPVTKVPAWYDVDDAASLQILRDEFTGAKIGGIAGAPAAYTRDYLAKYLPAQTLAAAE